MAEASTQAGYNTYKWVTFVSMYAGYTAAVFNRKSFSFAMPAVMKDVNLDKDQLGLISSSQNLAYTLSKFCGGILSDMVSAKALFTSGLFLSALITIAITAFHSTMPFAILWFLQGLVQGGGWPACAKVLKQWTRSSEFGFMWGALSTSMNVACAVGPLITVFLLRHAAHWQACLVFYEETFGTWYSVLNTTMNLACSVGPLLTAFLTATMSWQATLTTYGLVSLVISVTCYFTMWNAPSDAGFVSATDEYASSKKTDQRSQNRGRGTWKDMLRSPFLWLISLSYLIVFLGRTATLDWAQLYLVQDLQQDHYVGSIYISSLEVGGIVGSIAAGLLADKLVSVSKRDSVRGSPRLTVVTLFLLLNIAGIHALIFLTSPASSQVWIMAIGFVTGCGIYGPVSLYGVMAIEAAPTHLSGTSHAIVSLASNIGAVLAGLPFSYAAKYVEWKGAFVGLEAALVVVVLAKLLFRNVEYKMVSTRKKMQ